MRTFDFDCVILQSKIDHILHSHENHSLYGILVEIHNENENRKKEMKIIWKIKTKSIHRHKLKANSQFYYKMCEKSTFHFSQQQQKPNNTFVEIIWYNVLCWLDFVKKDYQNVQRQQVWKFAWWEKENHSYTNQRVENGNKTSSN